MQSWQTDLTKKCSELNLEAALSPSGLTIVCPKLLDSKEESQLLSLIPEDIRPQIKFEEGPKPSTLNQFKNLVMSLGVVGSLNAALSGERRYKIIMSGDPSAENVDWSSLSDILKKDGYFDSWEAAFNGQVVLTYNRKIAEELQKNQSHDTFIRKDDILNLKILLGTEMDFDKLMEKL